MRAKDQDVSIEEACELLFGRECREEGFYSTLDRALAKAAFRKRALSTHPDRARQLDVGAEALVLRFKAVVDAFEVVDAHLATCPSQGGEKDSGEEERRDWQPPRHERRRHDHRGPLPRRSLRFAEYLYYSGLIPRHEVARAAAWQRSSRPRIGGDALELGLLDERDVETILRSKERGERFGECARRLGLLSVFWIKALLRRQRDRQPKIGDYFVAEGLIRRDDLDHALRFQCYHNGQFDDA